VGKRQQQFEDAVSVLKAEPFDRRTILLINKDMEAMLVTWPYVPTELRPDGDATDDPWGALDIGLATWADLSGVPTPVLQLEFERLRAMRMVYPDGTSPDEVDEYLGNRADARIGS